jgi:two-component system, LytTR family, sensor histidine kinase AlgZ
MQSLFQRNRVLLLHLSFWCVYLSFFFYQISSHQRSPEINWGQVLIIVSVQLTFAILIAYLNYFYFLPRFLVHKNVWLYLVELAVPFTIIMFTRLHLQRYLLDGYTHREEYLYEPRFVVQVIAINLFIVIFVGLIRFAVDWFELESKQKAVENERLIAELNFLKAQINPHFLFNTLNNLYSLAYTKSSNTTEVIAKLSQMMRYMIYDTNHPFVPLNKEIEYMQNYISLEQLRLNNEIPITFEVTGDTDNVLITPLIFITFLENAFKHGISNNHAGAWITISITLKDKECTYEVKNSKIVAVKEGKSGIGLQNVQRRLALSYPDRYVLTTDDQPDYYFVQLKILLS